METKPTVLIASEASEWRKELQESLAESHEVFVTDDGSELSQVLQGEDKRDIRSVIIGENLKGTSALDALYRGRHASRTNAGTAGIVLLMTDVTQDRDLLNLFRSRGVNDFFRRNSDIEVVRSLLARLLYRDHRVHPRYSCNLEGSVEIDGDKVPCIVVDVSLSGVQVILKVNSRPVATGDQCSMSFAGSSNETTIRAAAIICNLSSTRYRLRKRSRLGLRFNQLPPEEAEKLALLVERLAEGSNAEEEKEKEKPTWGTTPF